MAVKNPGIPELRSTAVMWVFAVVEAEQRLRDVKEQNLEALATGLPPSRWPSSTRLIRGGGCRRSAIAGSYCWVRNGVTMPRPRCVR